LSNAVILEISAAKIELFSQSKLASVFFSRSKLWIFAVLAAVRGLSTIAFIECIPNEATISICLEEQIDEERTPGIPMN
jgi:hypothetical protein